MRPIKQKQKRKRINYSRLAIVFAIALVVTGGLVFATYKLIQNATSSKLKTLPFSVDTKHEYIGTGFLYLEGTNLQYFGILNDSMLVGSVDSTDLNFAGGSNIKVIYHTNVMAIVGVQGTIEFPSAILKVRCGANHVGVVCQDEAGALTLYVYDSAGNLKDQHLFDTQTLIDFGFYTSQNEALWTLDITTTGEIPTSTIKTYNIDSNSITGMFSVQNQAVDRVLMKQNAIFVVGTNHLIRYSANNEAYRILTYGYDYVDSSSSCTCFLFAPKGRNNLSLVRLYNVKDDDIAQETITDITLPNDTIATFLVENSGTQIAVVTPNSIRFYKTSGALLKTVDLDMVAVNAKKLEGNRLLIEGADRSYYLYHVR